MDFFFRYGWLLVIAAAVVFMLSRRPRAPVDERPRFRHTPQFVLSQEECERMGHEGYVPNAHGDQCPQCGARKPKKRVGAP